MGAAQEGIGGLLEIDAFLPQATGQPVMLVETQAGGKGEVGTDANEDAAPVSILDVEVVLQNPALDQLQMPAVVLLLPDGGQDSCRFAGLQDNDHLVGLGPAEVGFDELIPSSRGSVEDGDVPFRSSALHPIVKLFSDASQQIPTDGILIPIGAEETDNAFGPLERLDDAVEQNPVEATVAESDAMLVMLVESVHGQLLCGEIPGA